VSSLFPPGAGGEDTKGPVREPVDSNEREGSRYAPRPPSERGTKPERQDGVGVFRLAGWGWGFTIALFLIVGALMVIGYLRDDPGRNPAPSGYRHAVCDASADLSSGTAALERGVADRDAAARDAARAEIEEHVANAVAALADLPEWTPGRSLDELLGAQIITLSNGAVALESGPVEEDLEAARTVDVQLRDQLSDGSYGFTCGT